VSSCCEKLVDEAGDSTGTQRRETSSVESRYHAATGKDTADWEDLVRAVVNGRVCELATVLQSFVVTICK
jgi:hypothetical protein